MTTNTPNGYEEDTMLAERICQYMQLSDQSQRVAFSDVQFHLRYLHEAVKLDSPDIFATYMEWAISLLKARQMPISELDSFLNALSVEISQKQDVVHILSYQKYIQEARHRMNAPSIQFDSFIKNDNPFHHAAHQYLNMLLQGKRQEASLLIDDLLRMTHVKNIYEYIFQPVQYEMGRLWQTHEITVAHEHYCTAATQLIMSGLYKQIFTTPRIGKTLVASAVAGELHELGIRMVSDFFELEGWDTYYLGANMPEVQLVQTIEERRPDVVAFSVTMPYHVSAVMQLIKHIRKTCSFSLHIIVGGYAFKTHPGLCKQVGADGFAESADEAVKQATKMTNPS